MGTGCERVKRGTTPDGSIEVTGYWARSPSSAPVLDPPPPSLLLNVGVPRSNLADTLVEAQVVHMLLRLAQVQQLGHVLEPLW